MKQGVIKTILLVCIGVLCLGLLFLFAWELSEAEEQSQTTDTHTTELTTEETFITEPSETVLPTETIGPVLEANPFASADFVRDGEWMTCLQAEYLLGVDVSKYQGTIDWEKVAESGIKFAVIRVGGRGYGQTGNLFTDDMAQKNYAAAKAAGLQVGAYFFSQAISEEEAKAEAEFALAQIQDWELNLPVVFDWEYISETARTAHTDGETVTACAAAFCQRIQEAGKQVMLYVRPEATMLNLEELAQYPRWVALYSNHMNYPYSFIMWQYTKTGKVPGINGDVDINIYLP